MIEPWVIYITVSAFLTFTHAFVWRHGRNNGHRLGYLDAKETLAAHITRIPDMIEQSIEADRKHGKGKNF